MLLKLPLFLYDEEVATGGEPVEPETTPPEPQEPEPAAEPSESPWSNDITEAFEDEAVRQQVDQFMRDKYQPYVTKLETDSVENRKANNLWNQITEDPRATFEQIARELNPRTADAVIRAFNGEEVPEANDPEPDEDEAIWEMSDLPKEVREMVEAHKENELQSLWDTELDKVKKSFENNKDVEFDEDLFFPFISAADGDFDEAATRYENWYSQTQEKLGIKLPEVPDDPPPTTINSASRQTQAPPQEKKYDSLDAALDDFLESEKQPPPVVGAT